MARLSVVIPTWNAAHLVSEALAHLTATDIPSWAEVIVVDDGSQDGTAEQTQARFPQVQVVRHDVNRGFGAAVNTGFKAACGTFLAAVNNDALVTWNCFDRLVGFLRTHPDAGAAAPSILDRDGHNQRVGFDFPRPPWQRLHAAARGSRPTRGTGAPEEPYRAEYVRGACVIFKRAALQQAGLFDEQFHMFAEEIGEWETATCAC